jgi:hypothetical protein
LTGSWAPGGGREKKENSFLSYALIRLSMMNLFAFPIPHSLPFFSLLLFPAYSLPRESSWVQMVWQWITNRLPFSLKPHFSYSLTLQYFYNFSQMRKYP